MRDPDLKIALNWKRKYEEIPTWAERYSDNFDQVINFIVQSKQKQQEEEESRKRTNSKFFFKYWIIPSLIAVLGIVLIINLSRGTNDSSMLAVGPSLFSIVSLLVVGYVAGSTRIIRQGDQALVERLGRYQRKLSPGINFIVPFLETIVFTDTMRERILDIPPQSAITRDNISIEVDGIIYWRILDLERAYYEIEDIPTAITEVVTASLRAEISGIALLHLFNHRDELNRALLDILDEATEPWGVKVTRVEVQSILIPQKILDAMQEQQIFELRGQISQSMRSEKD
jgi:hypothetical protein